ncbi:MAG: cobalamin-dependent protein [Dehalococcoidales bacterium]|nr:cobalamin-dependent protein [Dehalococcoidales bacterium]
MAIEKEARARQIMDEVVEAIVACDSDVTTTKAQAVLDADINPVQALQYILGTAAETVGKRFDDGEYFLPHLVMAGDAMMAASAVIEPAIPKGEGQAKKVVVIATVEADLHSVGKNIVGMMLRASGFQVHDLGVDVKSTAIIAKAKEVNADIIALSSLLTTTMPYQREVVEDLASMKIRDRYRILIGGGAVSKEWADKIGADGYGRDAIEAVKVAKELMGMVSQPAGA